MFQLTMAYHSVLHQLPSAGTCAGCPGDPALYHRVERAYACTGIGWAGGGATGARMLPAVPVCCSPSRGLQPAITCTCTDAGRNDAPGLSWASSAHQHCSSHSICQGSGPAPCSSSRDCSARLASRRTAAAQAGGSSSAPGCSCASAVQSSPLPAPSQGRCSTHRTLWRCAGDMARKAV